MVSHGRYGQQCMQAESGQIINTGSDCLHLIQFSVENMPGSNFVLADCIRFEPNGSGLEQWKQANVQ